MLLDEFNRLDKKNENFLVFYLPSKYNNDLDKKFINLLNKKLILKLLISQILSKKICIMIVFTSIDWGMKKYQRKYLKKF